MSVCVTRRNCPEGRFPGNEIHEFSAAPIFIFGIGHLAQSPAEVVVVKIRAAGMLSHEPGLDQRRGREILFVRNGLGDERPVFKLLTARFQFTAVLAPRARAAPIFLGVKQRDECGKAGCREKTTTNHSPVKQPAEQPSKSWEMAASSLGFGIVHANSIDTAGWGTSLRGRGSKGFRSSRVVGVPISSASRRRSSLSARKSSAGAAFEAVAT